MHYTCRLAVTSCLPSASWGKYQVVISVKDFEALSTIYPCHIQFVMVQWTKLRTTEFGKDLVKEDTHRGPMLTNLWTTGGLVELMMFYEIKSTSDKIFF